MESEYDYRWQKYVNTIKVVRKCLKCDKEFIAKGKHIRLCNKCKKDNLEIPEEHQVLR